MTRARADTVELATGELVDALAIVLLTLDITPDRLSEIARSSFVKAAAEKARKRSSGKPHLAKIAAQTGLSRTEVKRIVASNFSIENRSLDSLPRALRVLEAWRRTPPYSSGGEPRTLRLSGKGASFSSLCKAHSGDIPYRVILNELERRGLISLKQQRTYVTAVRQRQRARVTTDLVETMKFASAVISAIARREAVLVRRRQRIAVASSVAPAYVEQSVAGRVQEMLDQLPQLFPPKRKRNSGNGLDVFAVVSRSNATKVRRGAK
jgi:hypothetical protein